MTTDVLQEIRSVLREELSAVKKEINSDVIQFSRLIPHRHFEPVGTPVRNPHLSSLE